VRVGLWAHLLSRTPPYLPRSGPWSRSVRCVITKVWGFLIVGCVLFQKRGASPLTVTGAGGRPGVYHREWCRGAGHTQTVVDRVVCQGGRSNG